MGIAREVHTEFPYLPSSSLRGRIRAAAEKLPNLVAEAGKLFGQKIKDGQQPSEGEIWFGDAYLIFFPVASLSHHLVWISCPLLLSRWNRWMQDKSMKSLIEECQKHFESSKKA